MNVGRDPLVEVKLSGCEPDGCIDSSEEPLNNGGMTETMTLSTFVQRPTKALVPLDGGDDVLLTRRDGEDLRMQRECDVREREVTVLQAVNVACRVLEHDEEAAISAVVREFAWASILSPSEANEFAVDYLAALRVSASLGNYSHVSTVVQAWKSSAEIKSDPELLARIERRLRDEELIIVADPRLDDVRGFGG
jgi:hypothetical protein